MSNVLFTAITRLLFAWLKNISFVISNSNGKCPDFLVSFGGHQLIIEVVSPSFDSEGDEERFKRRFKVNPKVLHSCSQFRCSLQGFLWIPWHYRPRLLQADLPAFPLCSQGCLFLHGAARVCGGQKIVQ